MDVRRLALVEGHPTSGPGWVYVWVWSDGIRYIGATWLDPAARAELHLHSETEDPRSLALRAAVDDVGAPESIVAIPVPEGSDRKVLKTALIAACNEAGLLADDFIHAGEGAPLAAESDQQWLDAALSNIKSV